MLSKVLTCNVGLPSCQYGTFTKAESTRENKQPARVVAELWINLVMIIKILDLKFTLQKDTLKVAAYQIPVWKLPGKQAGLRSSYKHCPAMKAQSTPARPAPIHSRPHRCWFLPGCSFLPPLMMEVEIIIFSSQTGRQGNIKQLIQEQRASQ